MNRKLGLLFLLVASNTQAQILPENHLDLQDNILGTSNISEKQFNDISTQLEDLYQPVVGLHRAHLNVVRDWNDSTVNAYAEQSTDGKTWDVHMFGGLARRSEITPDGFVLVICHELGHHLGGFPFWADDDWAASEGQADYFATQVCARKVWALDYVQNETFEPLISKTAKKLCDDSWWSKESRALCYRTVAASQSLANLLAALGTSGLPSVENPDPSKVTETFVDHPEAQCRLDTYVAGAVCKNRWDISFIPGRREKGGEFGLDSERESSFVTCTSSEGYQDGLRPRCWYFPRL